MPASAKIIPFVDEKPWAIAMYVSRATQIALAIVAIGLDASVISQWDKNQYAFNNVLGSAGSGQIPSNTWVGGTPFTGIVMFTVSPPKTKLFTYSNLIKLFTPRCAASGSAALTKE